MIDKLRSNLKADLKLVICRIKNFLGERSVMVI